MTEVEAEFDTFVKRVLEKDNPFEPPPELLLRPAQWKASLEKLYQDIESYLAGYVEQGAIRMSYTKTELDERYLGSYSARAMTIEIGRQKVELEPIGTLVIGGRGRVDVKGTAGDARLVLIRKDARRPQDLIKVSVNVTEEGDAPSGPVQEAPNQDDYVWKIATAPPNVMFHDLTKIGFHEMLMEVVNA